MRGNRWSDNDRNFGPLTFSWAGAKGYRPLAIILKSWGSGDDDAGPASLRISLVWFTFIIWLPPILYPQRRKVYPAGWDDATVARLGRNWYWDVKVREYGFSYSDGFLQIHYGICPGDSSVDQTWSKHLPWTQWRHVRHSLYGLNGEHFWTDPERKGRYEDGTWQKVWEERQAAQDACPTAQFKFRDHDDEELIATTKIEEREWRFGTGWFKWLSLFRPRRIKRYLDLRFSGETGPEKGSWKGGTIGTSIEMLPGELHEAAFRRYCDQDHRSKYRPYKVTFVGPCLTLLHDERKGV
jgi:hypothetical protein